MESSSFGRFFLRVPQLLRVNLQELKRYKQPIQFPILRLGREHQLILHHPTQKVVYQSIC